MATAIAFAAAALVSWLSHSFAPALIACAAHALMVASGALGRRAAGNALGAPVASGRAVAGFVAGTLLGLLTLSFAFSVALTAVVILVLGTAATMFWTAVSAASLALWLAVLVALLSMFLPRYADIAGVLLACVGAAALNGARTRLGGPKVAQAIQAVWENLAGTVLFSDAPLTPSAVADLAWWGLNMTAAGLIAALLFHGRHAVDKAAGAGRQRLPRALILAALATLGLRLLVPSVHDRVQWVPVAAAEGTIGTSRPTLYNFTADWCARCHLLEHDLFADATAAGWLSERFVPVRVLDREWEDGENGPEVQRLRARFDIKGFPTLVVVAPDGTVLARHEGYDGNLREVRRFLEMAASGYPRR